MSTPLWISRTLRAKADGVDKPSEGLLIPQHADGRANRRRLAGANGIVGHRPSGHTRRGHVRREF